MQENLSCIGVEPTNSTLRTVFKNHCRNILEIFASSRWKPAKIQRMIDFEGKEALDDALRGKKGAIVVTAHLGNWELAALYLSSLGYHLNVVAGVQLNRALSDAVKEAKAARGITVVSPEHSYRSLFSALESNALVVLLVDGDIYTGGIEIDFFGRKAVLPKGPVQLSKRNGAPIVGGYCRRLPGGRYHVRIEPIIGSVEISSLTDDEALRRVYDRVESFISANRDQWCIFRRFWKAVN